MKKTVFWDVTCGVLATTDVSEEFIASIIRVERIGELGTTLAATSNRSTLQRNKM
jgi:demethoxyubiquinone hydroxylase (CLK1/Coq7/Cat5 family)